jgi:hypothetical protein
MYAGIWRSVDWYQPFEVLCLVADTFELYYL